MKELIKFIKELGLYLENQRLKLNFWWLMIGILTIGGFGWITKPKRDNCFLTANYQDILSLNCVVNNLIKAGQYQQAKQVVKHENLSGWQVALNPQNRIENLANQQKQILKDSPYLESALENLIKLNEALGKTQEAKHYLQLKWWVDPLKN